ncbi:hypothetical protein E2562_008558 [Oryza meyeriana var. granulata]|uniref:Uncharacterized protein n=1 Tax=Oryza meyeriana var. granulata TaxID=110450 RepID=A0A6G1C422_9ORYZ|nr:hypothetical protein E2562_008558 [Oryza meyeriana var. granulata]
MADPVVVPPRQTFERACIQAYATLAFFPLATFERAYIQAYATLAFFPLAVSALPSASSPLILVPNVALRTTILNWCNRLSLPYPTPLFPDTAHDSSADSCRRPRYCNMSKGRSFRSSAHADVSIMSVLASVISSFRRILAVAATALALTGAGDPRYARQPPSSVSFPFSFLKV